MKVLRLLPGRLHAGPARVGAPPHPPVLVSCAVLRLLALRRRRWRVVVLCSVVHICLCTCNFIVFVTS